MRPALLAALPFSPRPPRPRLKTTTYVKPPDTRDIFGLRRAEVSPPTFPAYLDYRQPRRSERRLPQLTSGALASPDLRQPQSLHPRRPTGPGPRTHLRHAVSPRAMGTSPTCRLRALLAESIGYPEVSHATSCFNLRPPSAGFRRRGEIHRRLTFVFTFEILKSEGLARFYRLSVERTSRPSRHLRARPRAHRLQPGRGVSDPPISHSRPAGARFRFPARALLTKDGSIFTPRSTLDPPVGSGPLCESDRARRPAARLPLNGRQ